MKFFLYFKRAEPEHKRRVMVMLLAGLFGLGLSGWLTGPETGAMAALESDVAQLQSRLQAAPSPPPAQTQPWPAASQWPAPGDAVTVWPWLQQRLQAQGLQVLAMRPQAVTVDRGLPEQVVSLRLQGRWRDWLALERAVDAHVPWWVVDQWQVVPAGTTEAEVRIELQARLGLQPPALQRAASVPTAWPTWAVDDMATEAGAELFRPASTPLSEPAVAAAGEAVSALPADPRQWPVRELRLLGVWHQSGAAHAVLGAGLNRLVVSPGQRLGQEGWRVRRVHHDGVELVAAQPGGAVLHLTLQGDKP